MALWKDKLVLGAVADTDSEDPYQAERITWGTPIFANKKPVHASEFHAANASGRDVQHMFEVRAQEYNGQTRAKYGGKVFEIYRTFPKSDDLCELYLSSKGATADAARNV